MEMFDEITKHEPDGKKVEVKEEGQFRQACDDLIRAHRRFAGIDAHVRTDYSIDASQWFIWLGERYACERRVWELFCAGFETDKMVRLYLEFRGCLLRGESLKPNA